jgi:hypothetical protein
VHAVVEVEKAAGKGRIGAIQFGVGPGRMIALQQTKGGACGGREGYRKKGGS